MKKRITKTFSFEGKRYYVTGKTKEDAAVRAAMRKRDLEEGRNAVSGNMTVKAWAEKAVETYKTNQKPITLEKYLQLMNNCIIEHIGTMLLKSVKPAHCQNVLNKQSGKSKGQINKVCQTMDFIFRKALENNLISSNPAAHLTKPSGTFTPRRAITDTERDALLKVCASNHEYIVYLIMLYCGCRPSEAREIQGRDIQTYNERYVLHIRGTKNSKSDRYVPLDEDLRNTIVSMDPEPYEYISVTRAGNKHDQQSFTRLTDRLRHDMNIAMGAKTKDIKYETLSGQTRTKTEIYGPKPLAEDFVPYCLRHTYCTDLKDKGIDIRDAQYLMGHSDISTTANIYTHGNKDTAIKVAGILDPKITTGGTTVKGRKRHKNTTAKNQRALKKAK